VRFFDSWFFVFGLGISLGLTPFQSETQESRVEKFNRLTQCSRGQFLTGECEIVSELESEETWRQVDVWSEQLTTESDRGSGEKE
jgi:hypothetical protein